MEAYRPLVAAAKPLLSLALSGVTFTRVFFKREQILSMRYFRGQLNNFSALDGGAQQDIANRLRAFVDKGVLGKEPGS